MSFPETNESRQHPLQYFEHVSLWRDKATIHLNAEVFCEGQVRKEKSEVDILLYIVL